MMNEMKKTQRDDWNKQHLVVFSQKLVVSKEEKQTNKTPSLNGVCGYCLINNNEQNVVLYENENKIRKI